MTEVVRTPIYDAPQGKEVYIPQDLRDNDFTKAASKWSFARCAYTDDVIVFWEKPFGPDLSKAPDLEGHNMKVDLMNLMGRIQTFYDYYKNDLKFIKPGSNADKYRMMVMLNYSLEGTAYVTRQSVHNVAAIRRAKKAIRHAFENSMEGKGSNLIEFVSTCSSGWKLSPVKANQWMEEHMFEYYHVGDLKDSQRK